MSTLTTKTCVPCEGGMPPLTPDEVRKLLQDVPGWEATKEVSMIVRSWTFRDFSQSMIFTNAVAQLAEEEGHHPNILIYFRTVTIELTTHAVKGLSENDFILAAKINELQEGNDMKEIE